MLKETMWQSFNIISKFICELFQNVFQNKNWKSHSGCPFTKQTDETGT